MLPRWVLGLEGGLLCAQFKVDARAVKALRDKTGAGMMDAKKALIGTNGDIDKAVEYLRKKGLASADKKAGRVAAEGIIASYIHAGSRCGQPCQCTKFAGPLGREKSSTTALKAFLVRTGLLLPPAYLMWLFFVDE